MRQRRDINRTERRLPPPGDGRGVHGNRSEAAPRACAELQPGHEPRRKPLPVEISSANEAGGWKLAH